MSEYDITFKYIHLFAEAWKNVLDACQNGTILPRYEGDLHCHLFSECLRLMKEKKFGIPYRIFAKERFLRKYPDLTLGELSKEARYVAVEVKYLVDFSEKGKKSIASDIKKLLSFLKEREKGAVYCYFVMVDVTNRYREALDLKLLGIKKQKYRWEKVNIAGDKCDTLIAWLEPAVE